MSKSLRVRAAGLAAAFALSLMLLLPQAATAQWTRVGTGDFNGDGTADLLLRDGSGRVAVQLNNGLQVTNSVIVGNMSGNWSVAAVADFNGDGRSDILWHNHATGAVREWQMNGVHITNSTIVGNMPTNASVVSVADFNGDGRADILWSDGSGNMTEWLMNGMHVRSLMVDPNDPNAVTIIGSAANSFTGAYFGGTLGSLGMTNTFTNLGQFSLCPPLPAICIPDMTPSPAASASGSGFGGNFLLGYNAVVPGTRVIVGIEGLFGGGGGDIRYTGIPGTFGTPGGIAPAAGAAGDSVTISPKWNAGILGTMGTTVQIGPYPLFLAFRGGFGFQRIDVAINCTGAAGACGGNGIPLQSLTTSSTLTGSLIGGEIDTKLRALPPFSGLNLGFLNNATVGFQYLRGDYGTFTTTLGNRAQIQLTTSQKVTTDSAMAKITIPFNPYALTFPTSDPYAGPH